MSKEQLGHYSHMKGMGGAGASPCKFKKREGSM